MNTVSEPLLRLQLIEIEILFYQFAKCFKKDINEVLEFMIGNFIKEYNISLETICLSHNEISKMTIPKLKDELKLRNLLITGKKQELTDRLITYIDKLKSYS